MGTSDRHHWQRIEKAFAVACELDARQRRDYLDQLAREEPVVYIEVKSLLDVQGRAGSFLEDSALAHLTGITPPPRRPPRSDAAMHDPMVGRTVGRYRITRLIASGGMGTVYLAERADDEFRQQVAIKLIRPGLHLSGSDLLERFQTERQALADLSHPNIARLIDGGTTDSPEQLPFLVMEHVNGTRIDRYCDAHRLTIEERIKLFRVVCDAVHHAHQNLIIHRDLKPSNILVVNDDSTSSHGGVAPKVIDFGLARILDPDAKSTRDVTVTAQRRLTPAYASPEQIRAAQGTAITTASDVYSLGVVLYELLTGRRPYRLSRGTDAELEEAICDRPPTRPRAALLDDSTAENSAELHGALAGRSFLQHRCEVLRASPQGVRRALRGDLETILLAALAKEPEKRYRSAEQFSEDLGRYLRDEPIVARPPSTMYLARKFVQRNRPLVLACVLVFALLILAIGGTSAGMLRANAASREALARESELERIVQFQASRIADIDTERMGALLHSTILEKKRITLEREELDSDEIDRELAELDRSLDDINFTSVALETLDETIVVRTLDAVDREFADDLLIRARLLETLATTTNRLGLLDRALEPQFEALQINREQLGDDHPATLRSIFRLGQLLENRGRLDEAEALYREALAGQRETLGVHHRSTLNTMRLLATNLAKQGHLHEAERQYRVALEQMRQFLGESDPATLTLLNELGVLLVHLDRFEEAERVYREALKKRRATLGDDHPDTIGLINNLGALLSRSGRLAEAEVYYREALDKRMRIFGEDHPGTLVSINNMGSLLMRQGRLEEAERYYRQALVGRLHVLGKQHPETLRSMSNLASVLMRLDRLDEAEQYSLAALDGRIRMHGREHPDTLVSKSHHGHLLRLQGRFDEAELYLRRALDGRKQVLGERHQDTLRSMRDLVVLIRLSGNLTEAERLGSLTVEHSRQVLSEGDRWKALLCAEHALTLAMLKRFSEAEAHFLEARATLEQSTGPEDATIVRLNEHLDDLYNAWHDHDSAAHDPPAMPD